MKIASLLCATTALILPAMASAQSTGTVDFEEEEIIVTGSRTDQGVGGVVLPDTPKAKAVLTQEFIARQNPGQTILDTVNQVPGVSFQNNDAYGSSGGTLTIRGFTSDRISLTFDGIPLNDTGNYAIYSNQQIDPELIDQVNVNLGTTDVDSPTASAVGGTVNYRTLIPRETLGARVSASVGQFDFHRVFGMIETGNLTSFGTRAWLAASKASNDNPFNNYGRVNKQQYNARLYQPLGGNDFVSIAGHYNQNRNNFFGSLPLRHDADRTVGSGSGNRYPRNADEREYNINYPCMINTTARAGLADVANTCGTEFDRRYNPSNTGNIRGASRFGITDNVVLTIDPSFQYVKANGGGTATAREAGRDINPAGGIANCTTVTTGANVRCRAGYLGGSPFFGRDLNGDGDILDTVTVLAPSQTQTNRYGVIANLRWDINDFHNFRASYTFDRGRHRQTGEVGLLDIGGEPLDVFPVNDPQTDVTGTVLQKRDRKSYAILNQVAGEYRGEFLNEALVVNAGLRVPFFKRDLNQYCFTSSASGFVECFGQDAAREAEYAALNPTHAPPQRRVFKYSEVLPNIGAVYDLTPQVSAFASFAKGLSVPGTDSLYNAFFFPVDNERARPDPETSNSFDLGLRYRTGRIQAMVTGWLTKYQNRLASAYDPELEQTVYRNLGDVDKYGLDGSISYRPLRELLLYVFGSWNKSEIKDNLQLAGNTTFDCESATPGTPTTLRNCAFTAGQREAGSPTYTFGGTVRGSVGPFDLGLTGKRTGARYVFDTNLPVFTGDVDCPGTVAAGCPAGSAAPTQIFGAKAPAYWLVNLDARYSLAGMGLDRTYVQLNVYNLFDQFYVGGFGGGLSQSINASTGVYGGPPFVQIGAPRTVSATLNIGF
ncbi:MAG TPA: TonB-dependent receptor [Allosphingosinicella sp.]|nr:TonB-dependent receptor [Allosphingosinicella sp.]